MEHANNNKRVRNYVFTINNYTGEEWSELAEKATGEDVKYCVLGRERGKENSIPHIQGLVCFRSQKTFKASKKWIGDRCHLEPMRGTFVQASDYCKKDGNFSEFGVLPKDPKIKGEDEQAKWERIWELAKAGDIEGIPAKDRINYYSTFKRIKSDYTVNALELSENKHEWVYGYPGTGKTTLVRKENPIAYLKAWDKWWDRYDNEEVVIIEECELDFARKHSRNLKVWADKFPFPAQIKFGNLGLIRPQKIVVISNYSIDEVFVEPKSLAAIKRRFIVRELTHIWEEK